MRVALFVVIVAAHVIMLLLLASLRRLGPQSKEPPYLPIFLPPVAESVPQQRKDRATAQPPRVHRSKIGSVDSSASPNEPVEQQQQPTQEPRPTSPDWRTGAAEAARIIAQHIVADEDAAKRKADALMSRFKPLPPPRVRGPQFGWDYAATHRLVPLEGGGFAVSINDHCQLLVLPLPFLGCSIGEIKPNGDLFRYMHPPMKYGDWDKPDADP